MTSELGNDLQLESNDDYVTLRGNEGVDMDGMEILLTAKDDILLSTVRNICHCLCPSLTKSHENLNRKLIIEGSIYKQVR